MIETRMEGTDRAIARVKQLYITNPKELRALQKTGRYVMSASRRRVREQRDLEGRPFAPRKRSTKRRMIRKITKHLRVSISPGTVTIYVGTGLVGTIARQLQEGSHRTMTAKQGADLVADQRGSKKDGPKASRRQARSLQRWFRKTPQAKLMEWFTAKQAGFLIRKLEGAPAKTSWQITIPARAFLGVSNADRAKLGEIILAELRKAA